MAYVVQQNGQGSPFVFFIGDGYPLVAKVIQGNAYKVHGTQGMVKTGVVCPGVNQLRQTHLFNPPEPLETGMVDDVKD